MRLTLKMADKKASEEKKKPEGKEAKKAKAEVQKAEVPKVEVSKAEAKEEAKENISKSLVDQVREGMAKPQEKEKPTASPPQRSEFIAVIHVHASKNNTIALATDLSGAETFIRVAAGMVVKSGREEKSPFAGTLIAKKIAGVLKERGVDKVDILIRGKGGHRGQKTPGRAASALIKAIARSGIKIRRIEDVTPIPHGGCKAPGGKRGRRV